MMCFEHTFNTYLRFISYLLCGVCVPISAGMMVNFVSLVISSSGSCKTHLTHWSTSMYPKQRNEDIMTRITNHSMGGSPKCRPCEAVAEDTPKFYRIIVNKANIQAKDLWHLHLVYV